MLLFYLKCIWLFIYRNLIADLAMQSLVKHLLAGASLEVGACRLVGAAVCFVDFCLRTFNGCVTDCVYA